MAEEGLKLHGTKLSPFVLRVEWALKVKGIKYEYIYEDLKNKSPQLLEYNPVSKMVPVLVHNQNPICESEVILEYIEDGSFEVFSKSGEEQLKAVKELQERLKVLEKYVEGKKFFGGETIGLVDIVAGWIPSWIRIMEEIIGIKIIDGEELPLLSMWMHDILELDLVKESMPPLDQVKAHMKDIREGVLRALH